MLSADWLENGGTEFTDPVNHAYISGTGEPHDIIFIGVPAKDLPQNMISWDYHNGTVTRSGKLHLDFSVMTLCDDAMAVMSVDKQYDDDTNFYYFISVPEGVMPDLTGWELSFTEYHSDAMPDENVIDKPDEIGTDGMTRAHAWLCSLPEYQDWESSVVGSKYITWENDVPVSQEKCAVEQNASFLHEPIELIDKLAVCGGSDYVMMKVPKEGAVHVLRSVADAEDCCQYTDDKNVAGENFDFRKKLTEEVFAEYDVLYFAFKDNQLPLYLYTYDLAGGSIAADGTTLHLSFHALMHDPEHLPSNVLYSYDDYEPDWNTYYFYTVPKGSLPDLSAITVSFEEYPIGAIPDELLTSTGETVEISDNGYITKHTKLQEYLETTQEYLDYVMSMPKPKFITWENSTEMLTDDCTEDNRGQLMPD